MAVVCGERLFRSVVVEGRGGFMVPPMAYPPDPDDLQQEELRAHPYRQPDWQLQLKSRWENPRPKRKGHEQVQQQQQQQQQQPFLRQVLPPPPELPAPLPGGGLAGVLEARVVGWDLGTCAAAEGGSGYAALCGSVALSDRAGVLWMHVLCVCLYVCACVCV